MRIIEFVNRDMLFVKWNDRVFQIDQNRVVRRAPRMAATKAEPREALPVE